MSIFLWTLAIVLCIVVLLALVFCVLLSFSNIDIISPIDIEDDDAILSPNNPVYITTIYGEG